MADDELNGGGANQPPQVDPDKAARRAAVKNQRDSIMQRLDRWIIFDTTPEFQQADAIAIQSRIERGNSLWKQMEELQLDHVSLAEPAEVNQLGTEIMDLEERYYDAAARLTRRMSELVALAQRENADANRTVAPGSGAFDASNIRLVIAPQQSNITNTWGYFDGTLLKWKAFMARFTAAIHTNDDVKPPYKFSYLLSSLKGRALETIKGFTADEANYEAAWNKLVLEYNRDYPLAREYLRQFFTLKSISDPATAEELKHIANVTNETLCNLEGLKYPVQQWDMIIVHLLHGLLNARLAYEWNLELLNVHGDKPTTKNMVDFLEKHAAAATSLSIPLQQMNITVANEQFNRSDNRNSGAISKQSTSRPSSQASNRGSNQSNRGSNQSNRAPAQPNNGSEQPWTYPCGACNGNHKIFYCPIFYPANLAKREQIVNKENLCKLCLQKGHTKERCRDMNRCRSKQCMDNQDTRHNSMLCPVKNADSMVATAHGSSSQHRSRSVERRSNKGD